MQRWQTCRQGPGGAVDLIQTFVRRPLALRDLRRLAAACRTAGAATTISDLGGGVLILRAVPALGDPERWTLRPAPISGTRTEQTARPSAEAPSRTRIAATWRVRRPGPRSGR